MEIRKSFTNSVFVQWSSAEMTGQLERGSVCPESGLWQPQHGWVEKGRPGDKSQEGMHKHICILLSSVLLAVLLLLLTVRCLSPGLSCCVLCCSRLPCQGTGWNTSSALTELLESPSEGQGGQDLHQDVSSM